MKRNRMVWVIGVLLAGCATPEAPSPSASAAQNEPVQQWQAHSPGGETLCSDGSEFRFYTRAGDPDKLLFYLQGGGACWMRSNCDPSMSPSYNINLEGFDPRRLRGIFDREAPGNPFADHSVVFVPYCSGDVHLGASDTVYPPAEPGQAPLTVHHRGLVNAGAALDYAGEHFGGAASVFVTGSSAGAIPSPVYAVKAAEIFPDAEIVQLGDGAGGYRRDASQDRPHEKWRTLEGLRDIQAYRDLNADNMSYEQLYIEAAKAHPGIQFARYDSAEDAVQRFFLSIAGSNATSLEPLLTANNADIRQAVPNFGIYVAGGDSHTILGRPEFYRYRVDDTSVRDWVASLAAGRSVADVRCSDCRLADYVGVETPAALKDRWMDWQSAEQAVEPFRIFDNVWYVGIGWVSAYIIDTGEGLILVDALYGSWVPRLFDNIEAVGLDPANIEYVIATHGHFDHAGGAAAVARRTGARVVMTAEDWALAAADPGHPLFEFPLPPAKNRIVAEDGDVIELGDIRIELQKTPGHTEGVLTLRYPVRDGDRTYDAITLGGVGLNFEGAGRTRQYIDSYERLAATASDIEVSLPNHPHMAKIFERAEALDAREAGAPHPFVDGQGYRDSLLRFIEAAQQKLEEETAP